MLRAWCLLLALGAWGLVPGTAVAQSLVPVSARQLVMPFENVTREPRLFWLSEGSAVLLADDLIALGAPAITRDDRLRAFERLRVPPIASLSHATVIRLGQVVGAAQVVLGSFELQGEELIVRVRAIRLDTGRLFPEIVERGPLSDIFNIYARIARRILPESRVTSAEMEQGHPPLAAFELHIKGVLAESPLAQINFLTQALKLAAPNFQRPRLALWGVHTDQGEHQQALVSVRDVPAAHPLARRARFLGAVSSIHLAQYPQAFEALTALQRDRADASLLNNLGVTQLRRTGAGPAAAAVAGGRATTYFREATQADPSDPDLFFNFGYAAWLDRDAPVAIAALREAVRRNPADDEAHYVLGVALPAAGRAAEAGREKELARQLSSTWRDWEARPAAGNAVPRGLERLKLAVDVAGTLQVDDVIVAAEQRDQRALALFHLDAGRRLVQAERDAEAIAELRRAVYLAPYESEAHLLLGRVYLRGGRTEDAITALRIAIWAEPGNAEARRLLDSLTPP